jgi:ribosomal protein L11 methyltransferase
LKDYPAIDVRTGDSDGLLALVDDFEPIAAETFESSGTVRLFFSSATNRDAAHAALAARFDTAPLDVSDEDWARRSQDNLAPITVGRITVVPGPTAPSRQAPSPPSDSATGPSPLFIVVVPSMGFGTGHHATTRLCLAALQTLDLTNTSVVDVGTGSGVLAMAADRLGAAQVLGIDYDADAVQAATENLPLNPSVTRVRFEVADLAAGELPVADVLTANLTGAMLVRAAGTLGAAVRSGGTLVLSGILSSERDEVVAAFAPAAIVWEQEEDGWIGLAVKKA